MAGNELIGGTNAFAPSAAGPYPGDWTARQNSPAFQPLTPADLGPGWMRARKF